MLEVSLNEVAFTIASGLLLLTGATVLIYLLHRERFFQWRSVFFPSTPRG